MVGSQRCWYRTPKTAKARNESNRPMRVSPLIASNQWPAAGAHEPSNRTHWQPALPCFVGDLCARSVLSMRLNRGFLPLGYSHYHVSLVVARAISGVVQREKQAPCNRLFRPGSGEE